jgi:hypothetical protein
MLRLLLVSPRSVREIALESLALRQQLAVFKRQCPRPAAAKHGSFVLGVAVQDLEGLAQSPSDRKARDGGVLGSQGPISPQTPKRPADLAKVLETH